MAPDVCWPVLPPPPPPSKIRLPKIDSAVIITNTIINIESTIVDILITISVGLTHSLAAIHLLCVKRQFLEANKLPQLITIQTSSNWTDSYYPSVVQ